MVASKIRSMTTGLRAAVAEGVWTRISSTKENLMQQSFCSKCGAAITADTKFCSSCGAAIHAPTSTVTSTAQVQVQAEENRDASILDSTLNVLVGPLKNGFVFFAIYFIFMLPTYYLPYVGSNSALLNVATSAAGLGLSPQFWMHVACLFVLVVVTWLRGCVIGKQWITVFPVIAGLFDMTPGLSIIPFVPTTMHVIALIMGVRGTGKDTSDVRVPVLGAAVSAVGAFVVVSGLLYSWAWPSRLESARPATAPSTTTAVPPQAAVPASPINPTGPEAVPQTMASKAADELALDKARFMVGIFNDVCLSSEETIRAKFESLASDPRFSVDPSGSHDLKALNVTYSGSNFRLAILPDHDLYCSVQANSLTSGGGVAFTGAQLEAALNDLEPSSTGDLQEIISLSNSSREYLARDGTYFVMHYFGAPFLDDEYVSRHTYALIERR